MTKMMLVGLLLMAGAVGAHADPLTPTRASQLVSLTSHADPNCGINGEAFTTRVTSDGSFELGFVIPQGRVLVVTSVDWVVFGAAASQTVFIVLGTDGGAGYFGGSAVADANGTAGNHANLQHAIRPGSTICIAAPGITDMNATLHGFLAKDR